MFLSNRQMRGFYIELHALQLNEIVKKIQKSYTTVRFARLKDVLIREARIGVFIGFYTFAGFQESM